MELEIRHRIGAAGRCERRAQVGNGDCLRHWRSKDNSCLSSWCATGEQWVVVDGYKRLRALQRLGHDTVSASEWQLTEADALLLERTLRMGETDSPIEQGWFLCELVKRFGLSHDQLARRLDRTKSWVSRRIGLVKDLPKSVQQHVHKGAIGVHAAMKYLLPLARANAADCTALCEQIAAEHPTSRQLGQLYA